MPTYRTQSAMRGWMRPGSMGYGAIDRGPMGGPPLPYRNIWGALIESLRNGLSAPLRRPHMGDARIIEQEAGSVPQTTDIPRVIDLNRYYESPAAACVALGISQPKLTKLIRQAKVRSIKIGRTRLIEKTAYVRRMARAAR